MPRLRQAVPIAPDSQKYRPAHRLQMQFLDTSGHLRKRDAIVAVMRWGLLITIAVLNIALIAVADFKSAVVVAQDQI